MPKIQHIRMDDKCLFDYKGEFQKITPQQFLEQTISRVDLSVQSLSEWYEYFRPQIEEIRSHLSDYDGLSCSDSLRLDQVISEESFLAGVSKMKTSLPEVLNSFYAFKGDKRLDIISPLFSGAPVSSFLRGYFDAKQEDDIHVSWVSTPSTGGYEFMREYKNWDLNNSNLKKGATFAKFVHDNPPTVYIDADPMSSNMVHQYPGHVHEQIHDIPLDSKVLVLDELLGAEWEETSRTFRRIKIGFSQNPLRKNIVKNGSKQFWDIKRIFLEMKLPNYDNRSLSYARDDSDGVYIPKSSEDAIDFSPEYMLGRAAYFDLNE